MKRPWVPLRNKFQAFGSLGIEEAWLEGKGCMWLVRKFNTSYLLSTYYVPSTVLRALDGLTHLSSKQLYFPST